MEKQPQGKAGPGYRSRDCFATAGGASYKPLGAPGTHTGIHSDLVIRGTRAAIVRGLRSPH